MNINEPQFCFITPTAYLEEFASQSSKHLCLAHLVDTDDNYAAFYANCRSRGDYIIMDNSTFELLEPYSPSKLIELGHKCFANAIVLPDYPFKDSIETIEAAKLWAPYFKDEGFETVFVPQSKKGDLGDWFRGYDFASTSVLVDIIGMSILGIPNALPHIPASYSRVVMTQLLQANHRFSKKRHHYLGLNAGPLLEIPALLKMNALWSCDSSNPFWMGLLGHEYSHNTDSGLCVKKVHFPVQFDYQKKLDDNTKRVIQHNINFTKGLFIK